MSTTARSQFAAAFTIFIWGSTFVVTKHLLLAFSPTEILVVRFVLAALCLLPFARGFWRGYGWRAELRLALVGLSGITGYYLAENAALQATWSTNVGLIVTVIPLLTAAGTQVLDRRAAAGNPHRAASRRDVLSPAFLAGSLLAGCGVAMVILNGRQLRLDPAGDLLALAAALAFALYSLLVRGLGDTVPPLTAVLRSFAWGIAGALPCWLAEAHPAGPARGADPARWLDPANLLAWLFLAGLASGLSYALWNQAIRELGAVRTNSFVYAVPVINTSLSVLFLGESLSPLSVGGSVLIIGGVFLGQRRPQPIG